MGEYLNQGRPIRVLESTGEAVYLYRYRRKDGGHEVHEAVFRNGALLSVRVRQVVRGRGGRPRGPDNGDVLTASAIAAVGGAAIGGPVGAFLGAVLGLTMGAVMKRSASED